MPDLVYLRLRIDAQHGIGTIAYAATLGPVENWLLAPIGINPYRDTQSQTRHGILGQMALRNCTGDPILPSISWRVLSKFST